MQANVRDYPNCRVLVVDDHPAAREGLSWRIAQEPGMVVCGEAAGVQEALKQVQSLQPDVAVVDITLKDGNGIDLIKRIKAGSPTVRVLAWSMHPESLYAERALRAGALGYMNKENTTGTLLEAIWTVYRDGVYLSRTATRQVLARALGTPLPGAPVESLSNRELQVFGLIGEGQATAAIAEKLQISVHTVETHRRRIKGKLGLKSGAELSCRATRWRLQQEQPEA